MVMQIFDRNAEAKLVEALNSVNDPSGWHALHFHLDELAEQFKSEYQVKIAVNLISDLLKNFDGGIFVLQDMSIIVVCYALEKALQSKLVFQLRYLYMDDALAYTDDGHENPGFYTAYELAQDWQAFLDLSTRRMALTMRRPGGPRAEKIAAVIAESAAVQEEESHTRQAHAPRGQFTAAAMAGIERELQHVPLGKVIRSQPVCTVQTGLPVRRMFDELYVQIAQLSEVLHAGVDFLSNRSLFRYFTQLLDLRMLDYLRTERDQYLSRPVSLNLNVESLLSERFAQFDEILSPASKRGVVLEVPVVDAFADMTGFHVVRKRMQNLGYRVCLDGVTADSFNHIQREKLGVDLVKVQWNAGLLALGEERENLTKAVRANSASRVILCRCDNRQAVEYGQSVGIALFQGHYVESLVEPAKWSA